MKGEFAEGTNRWGVMEKRLASMKLAEMLRGMDDLLFQYVMPFVHPLLLCGSHCCSMYVEQYDERTCIIIVPEGIEKYTGE